MNKIHSGLSFFSFKEIYYFYFMCMDAVVACICVSHACSASEGQKRAADSPWKWSYRLISHHVS